MARVEAETITKIVLHKKLVDKMSEALNKNGDEFWIRIVAKVDACETSDTDLLVYLQGPDGDEEELYHVQD